MIVKVILEKSKMVKDILEGSRIFKINNKKKQKARGSHGGATWHARPRGRATRTRAARLRGAFIFIVYFI